MVTSTLELEYVVRGYHEYMRYWTPEIGEILSTQIEATNPHDLYAVAVVSGELGVVGHVPRKISKLCNSFLARDGTIEVQVLGEEKALRSSTRRTRCPLYTHLHWQAAVSPKTTKSTESY